MTESRQVYLDNNATCKVSPAVVEAMLPFFSELYGNPSSMHSFGGGVAEHVTQAREKVAALLNVSPEEIIFTSCGTESDNHAIRGTLEANPEKKRIVTTKVEHPAVLNVFRFLAKRKGYHVVELGVNKQGDLDLDELRDALTPDTALLSVMAANNETGTLFPIDEIGAIAREKGVIFHSDAVQAAGKIPLDLKKIPVDLLSISGHKLHTPKGIGALYIRKGTRISPFMIGGHQEHGRRAGTENVPYIIAFGKACEEAMNGIYEENNQVRQLRDKLESGLMSQIPHSYINGNPRWRLPNTTNIGFEYIEGEAILLHLSAAGIAASSGSACTSGSLEPSHVLMAMEVPFTYAHGSVRFSLSRFNTEEEIDYTLATVPPIIQRLRDMSPFYDPKK
ncbi:MAG: cysteine desulfurase NifS [Candidatus Riflebacteria bacterium HGW-Riflebacteria-2]|jgi:cysteine desulfurase|nr:MAG: cysteine desulfurase NifS [Candidatus Riflebacteria bacterium HGW-Riflebacteria-2]